MNKIIKKMYVTSIGEVSSMTVVSDAMFLVGLLTELGVINAYIASKCVMAIGLTGRYLRTRRRSSGDFAKVAKQ